MNEAAEWDYFVSYAERDRGWGLWIAWTLEESDHRVLVQAWDNGRDINWTSDMADGIARAARTVAVLSDDYLSSIYGSDEWSAAWQQDANEQKLLTVRIAECDRPGLLGNVDNTDLFGLGRAEAKVALSEVANAQPARARTMDFSGARLEQLRDALVAAFDWGDLRQLMLFKLEVHLETITPEVGMNDVAFAVVDWAKRTGNLPGLVARAVEENPGNENLRAAAENMGVDVQQIPTSD